MANKMILNQLKVRGLYGSYDYDLDFTNHVDSSVRFITAPNGYGKSTILRLIECFFNRSLTLLVSPKLRYSTIEFYMPKYRVHIFQKSTPAQELDSDEPTGMVEAVISVFKPKGTKSIETKTITQKDVESQKDDLLPKTLNIYLKSKSIHLIADNRLWVHDANSEEHIVELVEIVKNTIEKQDDKISRKFNELMTYNASKQSFVNTDIEKLCSKTGKLLSRYQAVGIAKEYEVCKMSDVNSPFRMAYLLSISEAIGGDKQELQKLELFSEWVRRCEFANKMMIFRKKDGVVFVSNDEISTKILPEELSSGEKQLVVQAIELLFCTPEDSIVLVDEPELSYHVAWQMLYCENLKSIAKQRKLQCVVATHNPQMFNYDWDLSIDLFTQQEQLYK